MDNPFYEKCDEYQFAMLLVFEAMLTVFSQKLVQATMNLIASAEYQTGDNGEYLRDNTLNAFHNVKEQVERMLEMAKSDDSETMRKETFYKLMFHIQDNLLPSVLIVEKVYGDKAPNSEGSVFSKAIEAFIEAVAQ